MPDNLVALIPKPIQVKSTGLELFQTVESYTAREIPRLAISLEALDKRGKTFWSINTPPDPIAVVTCDPGTMAVVKRAAANGRRISGVLEIHYDTSDPKIMSAADIDKKEWEAWISEFRKFEAAMRAIAKDTKIRTLVWDTATELWQLAELCVFGKSRGNARQDLRTTLNARFSKVFQDLYHDRPDLNMVLVHRLKKKYVSKKNSKGEESADWNGEYEREGFNRAGFLVDLCVRADWDSKARSFFTYIDIDQPTRYGAGTELLGKRWYGMDNHFSTIAMECFPDSDPALWGL